MKTERFIANRIAFKGSKSFSRLIIRIATAAIAISVAVMIIAASLIKGFQHEISEKMFGFWGHIQITKYDRNYSFENSPVSGHQDFLAALDTMPGIAHVQTFATKSGIIKTKDLIEGIVLKGISNDFNPDFLNKYLVSGRALSLVSDSMSDDILLSVSTAQRLNLHSGDQAIIHFIDPATARTRFRAFHICGLYNTGLEEYDRLFALVHIRQIRSLNKWQPDEVGGFEVFLDDVNQMEQINDQIYYLIPQDMNSMTIRQMKPNIFDWLDLQSTNERVIFILMVIVAIINMTTALLILILERTNMIGVLKALGATNQNIQRIFNYHAAYIILAGIAFGNVIGLGMAWLQHYYGIITLPEKTYYVSVAPVEIVPMTVLLINLGTFVLALLAMRLPLLLVKRISPVKAITLQ